MNDKFASGFAQDLESMIALKRALGYSENTYLERAKSFDRLCFEVYPGQQELTQAIVLSWLKPEPGKSPQTIHGKAAFVRALGKYQKSIGKAAYILPDRFTAGGTVFIPYLFGDMSWQRCSMKSIVTSIHATHSVRFCSVHTFG